MVEFPQSVPNLTEASTNLYELIKGRNLSLYHDDDMRLSINRAVALETSRGWRIAKEKQSHKIDVVVAMAMAALGAVQGGQNMSGIIEYYKRLARGEPVIDDDGRNELEQAYGEALAEAEAALRCGADAPQARLCHGCGKPMGIFGSAGKDGRSYCTLACASQHSPQIAKRSENSGG